ncbi:MAG: 16S rRNA processing protein RimM [Candidatus Marinimicrobia bacterium]|nr:16S rRNA processing protein RimM [Candidatus Neomarinimicrobiota bacterium]MBL7023267.1 16S rRNA processing protein RimM [Candidatus Neomarinimicrobiota bacterium]MBL7108861.1 16S rRNA processing protein RimM [Candidatus Neomarinimicrobiota bacterium]
MNKELPQNLVILGEIIKPHGLKGEVKVKIYNPSSESLAEGEIVWLVDGIRLNEQFEIESGRLISPKPIMKFKHISSKEDAKRLVGAQISIERTKLPKIEDNEIYLVDLIGLQVYNEKDDLLGEVTDILNLPANDVLVVKQLDKEVLIPIIDEFIQLIDFENKKMTIHQMEGLID